MFIKRHPIKFISGSEKPIGNINKDLNVHEYVCFSIWRNGGNDIRYCRLKDTVIPIPPLATDLRFRTSHSCKSVYYLGEEFSEDGSRTQVLVVISLQDLSYKTYDLTKTNKNLKHLKHSSLITGDSALCFQHLETVPGKTHMKEISCYSVFDLEKQEVIWRLDKVERLFFKAEERKEGFIKFGQIEEDDNMSQKSTQKVPEKIFAIKKKTEISLIDLNEENEGEKIEEKKEEKNEVVQNVGTMLKDKLRTSLMKSRISLTHQNDALNTETRKYYRTYQIKFGDQISDIHGEEIVFETYIVLDDKVKKKADEKKQKTAEKKKQSASLIKDEAVQDNMQNERQDKLPEKKKKLENFVQYAVDKQLSCLVIIVGGIQGEQHKIFQFTEEHCESKDTKGPFLTSNRAGNTYLEFNQDWHLRNLDELFLIQTESNGYCSAKPLSFDLDGEKMPAVQMLNASKELRKDVWVMEGSSEDQNEITVHSICKSSTDDFLQCEALDCTEFDGTPESYKKLIQKSSKIRAQEIDITFPCLVYNIGLTQLKIQSTIEPDVCATIKLYEREFISFTQYRDFADIGFIDKRTSSEKKAVPFEQTGMKIAFLTRNMSGPKGEVYLNVLNVDPFGKKFELFETSYEAEMKGGIRDDVIFKSFITQVTSVRGLDVSFICQYNDSIIFDCITSTRQLPIRFPMPMTQRPEDEKKYFNDTDKKVEWETSLDITKGAVPMKQAMQRDKLGAVYFVVKTESGLTKVLRVDPQAEMGSANFIKSVFSMRCDYIHFFAITNNRFFIMDDKKKIRRLAQDPVNFQLRIETTLELLPSDQLAINYSEFDEFIMSDSLMHWDDKVIYLSESKRRDVYTWRKSEIMAKDHKFIEGPKNAKGSGMIYYIEQYDAQDIEDDAGGNVDIEDLLNKEFSQDLFKGYSIMLTPPADRSFIDILPQYNKNFNNFLSYIDEENIIARHAGRFFVFHNKGQYLGPVLFEKMEAEFKEEKLKIVCVSDSMEYFVFEGPEFKNRKQNKEARKSKLDERRKEDKTKEKKDQAQKYFYVFKLEFDAGGYDKKAGWKFVEQEMRLEWIQSPEIRARTQHSIDYKGEFTMAQAESDPLEGYQTLHVKIQSYQCKPMDKTELVNPLEKKKTVSMMPEAKDYKDINFEVDFDEIQRTEKVTVMTRKINFFNKRQSLGIADKKDEMKLNQLLNRQARLDQVWVFTNHIIIKSGSNLKYLPKSIATKKKPKVQQFNIDLGSEVWIQDIFATGIDDLVQILLINDVTKRIYVITWNLQFNREHSNFQSTFDDSTNPEYLLQRTYGKYNPNRFNIMLDKGALINMQNNLPVQFFDIENEGDWCPRGELRHHVLGQRRVQGDNTKYLELTHPGRIQHFTSYSDWTYWVRFEQSRGQHELQQGRISNISPIARFPSGISVFHTFSTNVKVLDAISNYISQQKTLATNKNDARIHLLPLLFLHSDPARNKPGSKTTPLHLALDKQSPMAFELMMGLLKEQTSVCVTSQLLDRLEDIINQESPVVIEFFDKSFFITDQFSGAQALEWTIGDNKDEQIVAVPGSFLTKDYLQTLVQGNKQTLLDEIMELDESLKPIKVEDSFVSQKNSLIQVNSRGPIEYTEEIEDIATEKEDTSNLRQVEAKLLDFNWIFTGNNACKFITVLAETDNDEIFATKQVRVLIDFLWQGYFKVIKDKLFLPFFFYLLSFSFYVTYLSKEHSNEFNFVFCLEYACLIFSAKFFMHFMLLEAIQIMKDRLAYFTDFWNLMDLSSLILNALYVFAELRNSFSENTINLIGAICIIIMWTKMFYWMRILKPFAAFIRIVSAIVRHIGVFSAMLLLVLIAFANCIMVLQLNRHEHQGDEFVPIFDGFTSIHIFDAIIHAYLTGLGDFNKDNYSEHNGLTVWIFFLIATFIVQLVFMNLLIAMMGDAYAEIMAIQEQSIMKELCSMMEDHIWMLDIGDIFEHSRYILWLTPDSATQSGSMVERQISNLQDFVEEKVEQSDTKIMRELQLLREDLDGIKTQLTDLEKREEEEDFY